jgi:hypothetical protein
MPWSLCLLELESRFARTLSQRLDAAVIQTLPFTPSDKVETVATVDPLLSSMACA